MTSAPPPANFAATSQAYERWVNDSINELSDKLNVVDGREQNTRNNTSSYNAALREQISNIAAQQLYQNSFKTYTTSIASTVSGGTVGSQINLRTLSLDFTLSRQSVVLLNITSDYILSGSTISGASGSAGGSVFLYISIDGVGAYTLGGTGGWIDIGGLPARYFYTSGQSAAVRPGNLLSAGAHNISATWSYRLYGSSGSALLSNSSISATVTG